MLSRIAVAVFVSAAVGCGKHDRTARQAAGPKPTTAAGAVEVPARYDEGRWVVRPVTASGDTLDLYTDSGGGFLFIARERLAPGAILTNAERTAQGDSMFTTPWPVLRSGSAFPIPAGTPPLRITTASVAWFQKLAGGFPARDGFLGNRFFAGRIWVFDYPAHRLSVLTGTPPAPLGGSTIPFTFKANAGRDDAPWFPRIRIAVDGDSLDLLFDTGATTRLTDSALTAISDGRPASRAASFITRTVFDRWHTRHPDWRVVARGEAGTSTADMIEVPTVSVAGLSSGPVWFTARPDPNFTKYMSAWMDRPIVGALGGSGLRYFRIVADYPHARATFTLPRADG